MTDSTFTSNHAAAGGAITIFDQTSAELAVTGSAFIANTAQNGGAIYNYDGLTATAASSPRTAPPRAGRSTRTGARR